MAPLQGLRVLDLSSDIAGPYCTKLLVDAGADVVKVEPPEGDGLRRWNPTGADLRAGDGLLFRFLNASKRSIVAGPHDPPVLELASRADVVVDDREPGVVEALGLLDTNPSLTIVSISPFGRGGPWAARAATEFTLQGWSGSIGRRGRPDGPPLAAGGRLGEWIGGVYAAVAALAGVRAARASGRGSHLDVSLLECMTVTLDPFTWLHASFRGEPPPGASRRIEVPSIAPTADGFVGFTTTTAQQFRDFLVLIERPDLLDDAVMATAAGRAGRLDEVIGIIDEWTTKRTTAECIESATLRRIPVAPIGNGETVLTYDHFVERGVFVDSADGAFTQPRVPYRISGVDPQPFGPSPRLGEHDGAVDWPVRRSGPAGPALGGLEGVRVIDLTAFWAGPSATHVLVALGADVIKVESIQRADGMRFTSAKPPSTERWWEWGWIFHAVNPAKRDVTLDLGRTEGVALIKRLIAGADVVIENYSPRVVEQFGLDWDAVAAANPRAVMVRMPAFGLSGPWRDRVGFAQTMEQVSGMAWVTGWAAGPPIIPGGLCDPLAGMHAVVALLLALDERTRTGRGSLVEVSTVEAALNVAAEGVIEWTGHGSLLERTGNRGPAAAPQGVYLCAGDDAWLALAVTSDAQWNALRAVMGEPAWAADPAFSTEAGRRAGHDAMDIELARWCGGREVHQLVEEIAGAGVPVAEVVIPVDLQQNPQLIGRGFFEPRSHPVVGVHDYPAIPFSAAGRPRPWITAPAPTLGQHNQEILGGLLGLDQEELAALAAERIIGDRPPGS
ncbi:MAG TPA: CoA transferase [Acidimicrobiales bacterium]